MDIPQKESREDLLYAAETFLDTLRKSTEFAQKLLTNNRQMAIAVQSLEDELLSAKSRVAFLERETMHLRAGLPLGRQDEIDKLQAQLEALAEEQNCLAHLFVTSDRFARAGSAVDALIAGEEVLHNLIGALNYGIWLSPPQVGDPLLLEARNPQNRELIRKQLPLVLECLKTGKMLHPAGVAENCAPIAVPLLLDTRPVGAILIEQLVPQAPVLDRLQRDLMSLMSKRLIPSMCLGTAHSRIDLEHVWSELKGVLDKVKG